MTETHDYFTGKDRPQTAKKLSILRKYFAVWLTIWSGDMCSSWVQKRWYVLDLFAGTGQAVGATGETQSGSPIIYLEEIRDHAERLAARGVTIDLTFIEQDSGRYAQLEQRVERFLSENPTVRNLVEVRCVYGDANEVANGLVLKESSNCPCFLFVDPFGLEIRHHVISNLLARPWRLDVLFNYLVEAIRRVQGVAKGFSSRATACRATLESYFGTDINLGGLEVDHPATYANATFTPHGYKVVAFRMRKPGSTSTQYDLLFASRNDTVINVMRDVYAKEMTDHYGQASLFGAEEYLESVKVIN